MTEKEIDLERVVHDPVYRRQVIDHLNAAHRPQALAGQIASPTEE